MRKTKKYPGMTFLILIMLSLMNKCGTRKDKEASIKYLDKIGVINESSFNKQDYYFGSIDSLCCDDDNNLYIADSVWNKVFKFDRDGEFVAEFGKEGQGPGEFLASKIGAPLEIVRGNNGFFYVCDFGNNRLTVFDNRFTFCRSFAFPPGFRGTPLINSEGDIFFDSKFNDKYLLDCFDSNLNYKRGIIDVKSHLKSRYFPNNDYSKRASFFFRKALTKNNHIYFLSNISLEIIHIDEYGRLLNTFRVNNDLFLDDFKKRVKDVRRRDKSTNGKTGIAPFSLYLDANENICLSYYSSSISNFEILRYSQNGHYIDTLRFPSPVLKPFCSDRSGIFYATAKDQTAVEKYIISKGGTGK